MLSLRRISTCFLLSLSVFSCSLFPPIEIQDVSGKSLSMQETKSVPLSGGAVATEQQRFHISVPSVAITHGHRRKNIWNLSIDIEGTYNVLISRFPKGMPDRYWFSSIKAIKSLDQLNTLDEAMLTKSNITVSGYGGSIPGATSQDGQIFFTVDFDNTPFNNIVDDKTQLLLTLERQVIESDLPGSPPDRYMFDYNSKMEINYKWEFIK